MATEVKIQKTGYEMTQATVVEWLKQEGDPVEEEEPLVIIDTQKTTVEIPAPCSGVLRKIVARENEVVSIGQTIAVIGEPDENIDDLLRRIAQEKEAFSQKEEATGGEEVKESLSADEEVIPLTGFRKAMAEHMLRSKTVSAHGTTFNEADVSNALEVVKESNKKISFTALLVKAAVGALKEFPLLNASSTEDKIILKRYYHLGVAVNIGERLIAPVVRDADRKDLLEITEEIRRLTASAEKGTLSMDEAQGGTFTISNGGRYGSLFFVPIIHQPQSAILGTGTIARRPVAVDNEVVIKPMMYICVSYDHRIIPGAEAQQFLAKVKKDIETFYL